MLWLNSMLNEALARPKILKLFTISLKFYSYARGSFTILFYIDVQLCVYRRCWAAFKSKHVKYLE